jgi:hypothetical protein
MDGLPSIMLAHLATKWSSPSTPVAPWGTEKYLKLEPSIRGTIRNDQRILELQPNAIETTNIEELMKLNTISLKL